MYILNVTECLKFYKNNTIKIQFKLKKVTLILRLREKSYDLNNITLNETS